MNNGINMTAKILVIVMMLIFCYNGGGVMIKCYEV